MKTYRALIFDWDGTLADSTAHIVDAVQFAFQQNGLPPPSIDDARSIIGLSLENAMLQLGRNDARDKMDDLITAYRTYYFRSDRPIKLFDQAYPLLQESRKHYLLGIATGKSRRGLERGLDDTKTRQFFCATRTADECASKPNPDMILSLCDEWNIKPSETLMIGDTTHDLLTAHNAGADAVGVASGAHSVQKLNTAPNIAIFNNLWQLQKWLLLEN